MPPVGGMRARPWTLLGGETAVGMARIPPFTLLFPKGKTSLMLRH